MTEDCLFCSYASWTQESPLENRVLYESNHYYVKPALGSFVPGYCLVIPKRHVLSISCLTRTELRDLDILRRDLVDFLSGALDSNVICFEHGPCDGTFRAGACYEHAHLHVLPWRDDPSSRLPLLKFAAQRDITELGCADCSYLYYEYWTAAKSGPVLRKSIFAHIAAHLP
jgi:diadenosine tetraphosphate (Ap4A) HIT family hydrolase